MRIKLSDYSTKPPKEFLKNEKKYEEKFDDIVDEIGDLSEQLYANKNHNLLVIMQGMDTSGKDGATEKVFRECSPVHCKAFGFKKPTDEEMSHDFLWRVHQHTPPKGHIHVFVRSHYEDILIQRVHNWVDESRVTARINAINAFEKLLIQDNNTTILKFFMHISKERQLEKLKERMEKEDKFWKHNPGDWGERKYWDQYMDAYEDAINRSEIPWIIAPVDSRDYRNYFIAKQVLETLQSFKLKWPKLKGDE